MDYSKESITKYLDDLSSSAPVPGGGSVAGITGALGAGLISKVANLTIGKEKYKEVEEEMKSILNRATKFREEFCKLSVEDVKAYKELSGVFKLPKEERKGKLEQALKNAAKVPFEICKLTGEAIKLCLLLVQKGNKNLVTDTGIASIMLECAFESALLNVEINLKSLKDAGFILNMGKTLKTLEENIDTINGEVVREVEACLER